MTEHLEVDARDGGVVVVTLVNPPLNALSTTLLGEIRTAFESLAADPSTKAVVVAGGEKAFAAGADISEFGGAREARIVADAFRTALDAVAATPRPVVAALTGFALGGGLELALACDFRVAAASARLGQPEVLLGIMPGGGATQRLPRLVGPARAKELIFSGRQVSAEEALEIGLVDRVAPVDETIDVATDWAAALARGAVVAMGSAKRAIDGGLDRSLAEGLALEAEEFVAVFDTDDARIGIESFEANGPGKARFTGR